MSDAEYEEVVNMELHINQVKMIYNLLSEAKEERDRYKKALEEIGGGRCMAHFEYCDIARAALK